MSNIRLSKVVKDLNVGLSTAVEFLQKKGHAIESNPNTKISDEQYTLLMREFSSDKNFKIESERVSQQRQELKEKHTDSIAIEGFGKEPKPKEKPKEKEAELIPIKIADYLRPQIKIVGSVDLEKKKKPAAKKEKPETIEENAVVETTPEKIEKDIVEKKPEKEQKPEPEKKPELKPEPTVEQEPEMEPEKELEPKAETETKTETVTETEPKAETETETETTVEQEPEPEPNVSEEIFSLGVPVLKKAPNVVGKIDLNTINQQTRPAKKTKEEKRIEREAKENAAEDIRAAVLFLKEILQENNLAN